MRHLFISFFVMLFSTHHYAQCYLGNCVDGWGTYIWESGEEYTGQWVNGKRTGLGVYDWPDGSFYVGYFEDDQMHGRGIYISGTGGKDLIGLFSKGTFVKTLLFDSLGCILGNCVNGVGVYIWENAEMYVGQWKDGKRTGYGRYDWADRSFYIGSFLNNMLEGLGEYVGADGQRLKGIFKANELVTPISDTLPVADSAWVKNLCDTLKQLLVHFVNDFETLKGPKAESEYKLAFSWKATMAPKGCQEALVLRLPGTASNQYMCTLLRSAPLSQVMTLYYALGDVISTCSLSCCKLQATELETEYGTYLRYATTWTHPPDTTPNNHRYVNLALQLEAESEPDQSGYRLRLLIRQQY
ncbi:MAG: hypothetical protein NZL95_09325 [Chitinophagales bacterium]|nr:hypothetical protein [Chitinophagales bacterium]MDW8428734.1 hypothetical protein [Chitinophagales bacterium]